MAFRRYIAFVLSTLFLLLFSSGCQDIPVAQDLSQKQASQIVAVLSEQGIAARAERGTGSRGLYVVRVADSRYSEANSILHYEQLPALEEPSVSELLAQKGFMPNSREIERLRIDRARASEIENLLKANPAVLDVHAVVHSSEAAEMGPAPGAAVSVVVRKQPAAELDAEVLKKLILNATPGVSEPSVLVTVVEAQATYGSGRIGTERVDGKPVPIPLRSFLGWWRVAQDDYDRMALILFACIVSFLAIGLFVGFSAGFLGKKVAVNRGGEMPLNLRGENAPLSLQPPES